MSSLPPCSHLPSQRFAQEVDRLRPRWTGAGSLKQYLEAFDEAGVMRPDYRLVLPSVYPHFAAQCSGHAALVDLTDDQRRECEIIREALTHTTLLGMNDPDLPGIEGPFEELRQYVRRPDDDEPVHWSDWTVEVAESDGPLPITGQYVRSYYGLWQRLRFVALLDAYTLRGLLKPQALAPRDVIRLSWDGDLKDKLLIWGTGDGRIRRLTELLEQDGWLRAVYRFRRLRQWAGRRMAEPSHCRWPEGEALPHADRVRVERQRLRDRAQALAPEFNDRSRFTEQLNHAVELWHRVTEHQASAPFGEAIRDDVWEAANWGAYLFDVDVEDLCPAPAARTRSRRPGLLDVLYPIQYRARRTTELYLSTVLPACRQASGDLVLRI